ncbi:MAG: precorrin-3B synthase [Planctomyces sp.]|nr:precorrin-3B synthase [Planctomyces sp.]
MANPVEVWKAEKHGLDAWEDIERHASARTPMSDIDAADLERMKWHGFFYRKRDEPGRYMNRIRVTANELSAEQAREIAYLAYEYGHGIIDVTTRANLQVQGLEISDVPKFRERLERVGLTSKQTGHDNIRNVFGHPFSGLLPDELIDTRALCHEVTALFIDNREYSDLPRKLNICFNGTEHHPAHFWTQDVSFLATEVDGEALFHLLLAGTQGQNPHLAWHVPVLVAPEQVVDVTRAILDLFRAQGSREKRNAARLRFLLEEIGVPGVLDWLERTLPFRLRPCVAEPAPASSEDELIGWFRQKAPRLWTMGLSVPLGRLTHHQLEGLALLSRKWGDGQLRTTQEQGIAIANIPTGFKDAAATAAAALGLSIHADPLERNTVACTGSQFCNIAVTETKGHMFQLIERLRRKALKLHGIRIHMSGCPSSCAQHFTADIGLKGVRVRRLLGTREGFDVFLGGGVAGQVHMGLPYKIGVDVDQLPNLVEEVVSEYYLRHKSGQTFSAYWREKLQARDADKVGDADYQLPTWLCEKCEHRHVGEDPPVFCPSCAGLRRHFARLEDGVEPASAASALEAATSTASAPAARSDGFVFAAAESALQDSSGLEVEVGGRGYALFRVDGRVRCIDAACPHEGASLAQGEFKDGVVTCPWHGWTFNACSGCSLEPAGNDVRSYETLVEGGSIYIRPPGVPSGSGVAPAVAIASAAAAPATPAKPARRSVPRIADLKVLEIVQETPDVKTFRLDNRDAGIPLDFAGQFAKVCINVDGEELWRSFTISSPPTRRDTIDLTIKRNPAGRVSNHLFDCVEAGGMLRIKGAQGGFFFDPARHVEPLGLVSAGSGITPMMSIVRSLIDSGIERPCWFLHGARTPADIIFHDECRRLAEQHPRFHYVVTLSQPGDDWPGPVGRLELQHVIEATPSPAAARWFLCGPNDFMENLSRGLRDLGAPESRIHTEQFHASPRPVGV